MPITLGDTSITGLTGNQGIGTNSPISRLTVVAPSTTNAETVELRGFRNFVAETRGATAILAVSHNNRNAHDFGAIRFEQNPATVDGGGALVRMFAGGASSSFAANAEFLRGTATSIANGVDNIQFSTRGTERVRIGSHGNQTHTIGSNVGDGGIYRRHSWYPFQSAFNNPTINLIEISTGATNASSLIKVRAFQLPFFGGSGVAGNEHIGLAWIISGNPTPSNYSVYVNTMSTTTNIGGLNNVGTLSWSGSGSTRTLRYTSNRSSNYDTYYVEVEVMQNLSSSYTYTFFG